jgi:cellulose biosynthesis protein BcsQ
LALNALAAVDEIMIPLQPHFLGLQGLGKLLQTVTLVNKRINPALKVKWVLLCMFEARASLPNEVKADIEKFLTTARNTNCAWSEAQILPVSVRRNITLAEAPSYGQTIFEYDPSCHGSEDYKKVAQLIHNQMQVNTLTAEHAETAEKIPIKIVEIAPANSQTAVTETVSSNPLPQIERPPQNPTI